MYRSFPVLVLTGARQTGKTTLLRHQFPDHHFVSLDLPSQAELADKKPEEFFERHPPPVVIDEVQYAPKLFRYIKVKVDEQRSERGRFILTGSQKFTLMKEISESLAGRCGVLELDTFSLKEWENSGIDHSRENRLLFLKRGGFPELIKDPDLSELDFFSSYVATYLERDVRALLRVGDLRDFERFLRMCALRSGQILNLSEMARDVGISPPTAKQWLSVLQASHQVDLLEPYFRSKGKSMIKTPKLYFRDTGLLCFLLGVSEPDSLTGHPLLGAIWETFVYGQLSRSIRQKSTAASLWFWRDVQGLEADFLIDEGAKKTFIEAKWTEHAEDSDATSLKKVRELFSARESVPGKVFCRTPHNYPLSDGIEAVDGFDWKNYS